MADLSFEAKHLLHVMQSGDGKRSVPLRNDKERAAMNELQDNNLVVVRDSEWCLTLIGYVTTLTQG